MWIIDPKTSQKSVSLTLLMISFAVCSIGTCLEMAGLIKTLSMSFELFGACSALYAHRKWISAKGEVLDGTDAKD